MKPGYHELLELIRMEYYEMPDLRLTRWQARKLWSLEPVLCDDLLDILIGEGFLVRTKDGSFARPGERLPLSASA